MELCVAVCKGGGRGAGGFGRLKLFVPELEKMGGEIMWWGVGGREGGREGRGQREGFILCWVLVGEKKCREVFENIGLRPSGLNHEGNLRKSKACRKGQK